MISTRCSVSTTRLFAPPQRFVKPQIKVRFGEKHSSDSASGPSDKGSRPKRSFFKRAWVVTKAVLMAGGFGVLAFFMEGWQQSVDKERAQKLTNVMTACQPSVMNKETCINAAREVIVNNPSPKDKIKAFDAAVEYLDNANFKSK